MAWSYASLTALKNRLKITTDPSDAILQAVLEGVSREIDDWTYRTFRTYLATRYYTAANGKELIVDDLLAVTNLKTDADGDRTYETTWLTTDYDLMPYNAAIEEAAYTHLRVTPNGAQSFSGVEKGNEIVGRWGYFQDLKSVGTLGAAITTTTATSVTMTSGHSVEALQTVLIDSEQLYVTAVTTNTLTVERGMNGTTAATHLNSAAVQAYRYRSTLMEATILQASRIARRADSPFGVAGTTDFGTVMLRATLDPDVRMLLAPLRRIAVG